MRPEDEISLEDFIRSVKGYIHLLLSHWKIFLLAILLSCAGLWFWSQGKAPTYKASLTLMLSDDAGQSVTGISSICLLYTSPSPRDQRGSRMPSSA